MCAERTVKNKQFQMKKINGNKRIGYVTVRDKDNVNYLQLVNS